MEQEFRVPTLEELEKLLKSQSRSPQDVALLKFLADRKTQSTKPIPLDVLLKYVNVIEKSCKHIGVWGPDTDFATRFSGKLPEGSLEAFQACFFLLGHHLLRVSEYPVSDRLRHVFSTFAVLRSVSTACIKIFWRGSKELDEIIGVLTAESAFVGQVANFSRSSSHLIRYMAVSLFAFMMNRTRLAISTVLWPLHEHNIRSLPTLDDDAPLISELNASPEVREILMRCLDRPDFKIRPDLNDVRVLAQFIRGDNVFNTFDALSKTLLTLHGSEDWAALGRFTSSKFFLETIIEYSTKIPTEFESNFAEGLTKAAMCLAVLVHPPLVESELNMSKWRSRISDVIGEIGKEFVHRMTEFAFHIIEEDSGWRLASAGVDLDNLFVAKFDKTTVGSDGEVDPEKFTPMGKLGPRLRAHGRHTCYMVDIVTSLSKIPAIREIMLRMRRTGDMKLPLAMAIARLVLKTTAMPLRMITPMSKAKHMTMKILASDLEYKGQMASFVVPDLNILSLILTNNLTEALMGSRQFDGMTDIYAPEAKKHGNSHYGEKHYGFAAAFYTYALELMPKMHPEAAIVLSNRAQAYLHLVQPHAALADCEASLKVNPYWTKSSERKKIAQEMIKEGRVPPRLEPDQIDLSGILSESPKEIPAIEDKPDSAQSISSSSAPEGAPAPGGAASGNNQSAAKKKKKKNKKPAQANQQGQKQAAPAPQEAAKPEAKAEPKRRIEYECAICFEASVRMALIPCGHCFCLDCANALKTCALCRADITGRVKLFL